MQNFIVSEAAKAWLASHNLEEVFNEYKTPVEMLAEVNTEPVDRIISRVKERIEVPEGVNVPNWDLTLDDLLDDTEVFVVTDDDLDNNLQVQVKNRFSEKNETVTVSSLMGTSYLPYPDVRESALAQIRELEEQRKETLLLVYKFVYELVKYLEYIHKEGAPANPNLLPMAKDALSKICSTTIMEDVKHRLMNVQDLLSSFMNGSQVDWPNSFGFIRADLLRRIRVVLPSVSSLKWCNVGCKKRLAKLAEKVLAADLDELKKIAGRLDEARRHLWCNLYATDTDWLACYRPDSGTIFLRLDKIYDDYRLFFLHNRTIYFMLQEVLLHEFIHAALDLCPRDSTGKIIRADKKWQESDINEETVDNTLILFNFQSTEDFPDIYNLISNQPFYYSNATKLFGTRTPLNSVDSKLLSLILYKVFVSEELREAIKKSVKKRKPKKHQTLQPESSESNELTTTDMTTADKSEMLMPKWNGEKEGLIDESDNWVIDPIFDEIYPFAEGLAKVRVGKKWGYINRLGAWVIRPQFSEAGDFSSGFAIVGNARYCKFIDKQGNPLGNHSFTCALPFSEGLAAVELNGMWGYINAKGEFVIQPAFNDADSFSEGLAPVRMYESWGYINTNGKLVIEDEFSHAKPFHNGVAEVAVAGRDENDKPVDFWRLIEKTGKEIHQK